jgi:hypothetical protein
LKIKAKEGSRARKDVLRQHATLGPDTNLYALVWSSGSDAAKTKLLVEFIELVWSMDVTRGVLVKQETRRYR